MTSKVRYFVVACWILLNGHYTIAQQSTQYTLFHFDKHIFNPAYAGLDPELIATAIIRNQWLGLQGAPTYQHFSVNAPLISGLSGVGLNMENDQLGLEHNTHLSVSYSHHIRFSPASSFSAGVRGVWSRKNLDGSKIITPDGIYEQGSGPDHKDGLLPVVSQSGNAVGVGVGLLLKLNTFELGAGADGLIPAKFTFADLSIKRDPTYFLNLGFTQKLSETLWLTYEGLGRSNGVNIQTDFAVKLTINNNIIFGGSFRGYNKSSVDGVSLFGGLRIFENLILMAAYDHGLSKLSTVHGGSIEFGIKYTYGNKIFRENLPPVIFNPRY